MKHKSIKGVQTKCSRASMIPTLKLNYEMTIHYTIERKWIKNERKKKEKEREANHTSSTSIKGNITSSSFLAYSLLVSKINSTLPGFTKPGDILATLVTAIAVALLPWIAWNPVCQKQVTE